MFWGSVICVGQDVSTSEKAGIQNLAEKIIYLQDLHTVIVVICCTKGRSRSQEGSWKMVKLTVTRSSIPRSLLPKRPLNTMCWTNGIYSKKMTRWVDGLIKMICCFGQSFSVLEVLLARSGFFCCHVALSGCSWPTPIPSRSTAHFCLSTPTPWATAWRPS